MKTMRPKKKTINLAVPADLLEQFNEVCGHYGHGKQKGAVLSAAMLMFLRADPESQGRCLEDIVTADIEQGVQAMLERARIEQGLRIATRRASERAQDDTAIAGTSGASSRRSKRSAAKASNRVQQAKGSTQSGSSSTSPRSPRLTKAARKAGKTKRGISKLPKLEDFH